MADLKARMGKQLTGPKAVTTGAPAPFRRPDPLHTHRVSLDLTDEDYRALKMGALDEKATVADILRSLVGLWRNDPSLRQTALERRSSDT